jgi:hypothetical protein
MRRTHLVFGFPLGVVYLAGLLAGCGGATAPAEPIVVEGDGGAGDGSDDGPGIVVKQCQAGQAVCNGSCVDLSSDSNHCGTCGNVCGNGTACSNATCVAQMTPEAGPGGLPPDPGGPAPTGSSVSALAVSQLYYGDTDRNGTADPNAWQAYGLDIDGKNTTASSTHVCTLVAGASKQVQVDGPGGIDNSFGENIVPILSTLNASFSAAGNSSLRAGDATAVFALQGLGDGPDYSPLVGALYRAAPTSSPPLWSGSDTRNPDRNVSPITFKSGYVNQRVWVGQPPSGPAAFDLHFGNAGAPPLLLQNVQVEMLVAAGAASATQGNLSAVVATADMVNWLQQIAGAISVSLCSGSAFQSIAQQIQQASDIVVDGQGNVSNPTGTTCNAISIGLGFDATAVQLGSVTTVTTPKNPCQ